MPTSIGSTQSEKVQSKFLRYGVSLGLISVLFLAFIQPANAVSVKKKFMPFFGVDVKNSAMDFRTILKRI
jgi:hypothetical protein